MAVMTTLPKVIGMPKELLVELTHYYHLWVLLTAHAPPGKGKTIVVLDTDSMERHINARECSLGFENRYIQEIRGHQVCKNDHVGLNNLVGEPYVGKCFPYTMEWLLKLAKDGLDSEYRNGSLVRLDGFTELKL
jgi:hypothetical protein